MKTDQEIVTEVKRGCQESFSELVFRYQKPLLGVSLRFMRNLQMAEDVVQEAFFKAYEKIDTFEGRSSFKSWLYQITVNTAKNKLRLKKRVYISSHRVCLATPPEAESDLVNYSVSEWVKLLIDHLPFKQKTALVLRIFDDMSFKEIAEVMDCPYDTAKANYRHALLKLRKIIGGDKEIKQWTVGYKEREVEFKGFLMEAE